MAAKNIVFRDDGSILVKDVRLSYPHVFKPWGMNEGDDKKYSAKALMDKKTHAEEIKALGKFIAEMEKKELKTSLASDKRFLRDGDQSGKESFKGTWVIAASESHRPDVINRDRSRINEEDDIIYAGCRVNILIRPWAQNNKFGKRINANLLAVQFVRDDEPFSSIERPDIEDAFDDVSEEFETGDDAGVDADADEDDPFA